MEHESQARGKKPEQFFSKVAAPENIEDALDDVVDGNVQAAAVDRAALEAYKRRKPGRFKKLKEIAHSQPFPPPLVAYYGNVLDEGTRERFRQGLLNASNKDKGQTMLTMFRLTGFEAVPEDFRRVCRHRLRTLNEGQCPFSTLPSRNRSSQLTPRSRKADPNRWSLLEKGRAIRRADRDRFSAALASAKPTHSRRRLHEPGLHDDQAEPELSECI